jgi:hypothetical protein
MGSTAGSAGWTIALAHRGRVAPSPQVSLCGVVSCVCVDSRPEASRCGCVASTRTFKGRPKPTQRTCPHLAIMCGCLLGAISPWYNNVARFKIRRPRSGELIRLQKLNWKAKMASRKTANVYGHQTDSF